MKARHLTRRDFVRLQLAGTAALATGAWPTFACRSERGRQTERRVIALGFDGMDPILVERMMRQGRLPTFSRVAREGHFGTLGTSTPPQSPVAWANFITGCDSGGHGIFDFIHRDPETYHPFSSTARVGPAEKTLTLGDYIIPLSSGKIENLRQGRAFWEILEEHDIPATVFKMPSNFPPSPTRQRTLSGMGTPDLLGTYGLFSYYTDQPVALDPDLGGGQVIPVSPSSDTVRASLRGPVNSLRRDAADSKLDFTVYRDPDRRVAKIVVGERELVLAEGEWSPWVELSFEMAPLVSVRGICRFFLKQVHPHFKLYVTPVEIDPADPALPISTPEDYARELQRRFGPFHTKGLPADTKALTQGILTESEFLEQDEAILQERLAIYDYELERFESGLLFFYVSSTDQRAHMFWRLTDPQHPAYDAKLAVEHSGVIERSYEQMDRLLEKTLQKVDERTLLLVLSDHGFSPYYRSFNLNTWLKEQGYLRLRRGHEDEDELLGSVDWPRTRAYALGFNSLYINQRGREAAGCVATGDKRALEAEIASRLEGLRDPLSGEQVVFQACRAADCYTGPARASAPDIVVGYNRGYRASWQTALGKAPPDVYQSNTSKWSGDHLMAAGKLSGILLSNRPLRAADRPPTLCDLTATLLDAFGIPTPSELRGRAVL